MVNRSAVAVLFVLSIFAGSLIISQAPVFEGLTGQDSSDRPERVIVVNIDTLRADRLGTYGYSRNTSPFIDSFSDESVVFERAVSNAEWTLASEASASTGVYPRTHRVNGQRDVISESFVTTAEVFSSNGYDTAAFTGGRSLSRTTGFGQGFDKVESNYLRDKNVHFEPNFREALNWMEGRDRSYVFIHGNDMHAPYGAPEPYTHFFDKNYTGSADDYFLHQESPQMTTDIIEENGSIYYIGGDEKVELDERDIEHIRAEYDASVRYIDNRFKTFVERLKERGMYEDSVIVLTSSHGETLAEHSYPMGEVNRPFGHRYLWDTNIMVPLIVKAPGLEPGRVKDPVALVDFAPTVYDIARVDTGEKVERQIQGETLLPLINDNRSERRDYTFSQAGLKDVAARGREWKLIQREGDDWLYSLRNGSEQRVAVEKHPEVYRRLSAEIEDWKDRTPESLDEQLEAKGHERSGIFSIFDIFTAKDYLGSVLEDEGIAIEGAELELKDRRVEEMSGRQVVYLEAEKDGVEADVRIVRDVEPSFAEDYIFQERNSIVSRFAGTAPYTDRAGGGECPDRFVPNITETEDKVVIESYGFEDTQGSCAELTPDYVSEVWMGYCEDTGNVFRAEVSGLEDERIAFSCR